MFFEMLEQRRLLSGNVTASLGTTGVLTITGDSANNNIDVNGNDNPGFIRVKNNGATSVNGVAFIDFPASSVAKISMNLNGGNDLAWIHDISGTIPNSISITDTASGTALPGFGSFGGFNNRYFLSNLNLPTASATVTTGSLADFVIFGLDQNSQNAGNTLGAVSMNVGGGNDLASNYNSSVGSLSILTGDGNDGSGVHTNTLGSFQYDGGKGNDGLFMSNDTISGSFSAEMGDGSDSVQAQNVVALSGGTIDGGSGSDVFENDGGNSGFSVINFEGFI